VLELRCRRDRPCAGTHRSPCPGIIASQTVPILAIAPMIVVVSAIWHRRTAAEGADLMYLCFFRGDRHGEGLRSPDPCSST